MATVPKGKTKSKSEPRRCFARRHMAPACSAYHAYALAVSRQSDVFYSDDRRDAKEFGEEGISNRTIFDLRRFLERKAWFIRIDKDRARKRNRITGLFECVQYRVLSHDEWAAAHPGHCRFSGQRPPDAEIASGPAVESTSGGQPPDAEIAANLTQILPTPDAKTAAKTVEERQTKRVKNTPQDRSRRSLARELQTQTDSGPEPTIDRGQSIRLWRHARDHRWSKTDLKAYLLEFFNVASPKHLTIPEFNAAIRRTQYPPPQAGKGKPSNVEAIH